MSKSLWSIVVLGFITVIIMVIMMLFSLSAFQRSPAFNRAKFSNAIRETFGFIETGAGVKDTPSGLTLRVDYQSNVDSQFRDDVMKAEMERVIEFAQKRYDGTDRRIISRLVVRRTEIQGSGCWQRTLEREMSVDKPFMMPMQFNPPPPPPPDDEDK